MVPSQEAGEIISHAAQQPQLASPVLTVPHNTGPCGSARSLVPQLGQSHRAMALSLPDLSTAPHVPLPIPALHNSLATFLSHVWLMSTLGSTVTNVPHSQMLFFISGH